MRSTWNPPEFDCYWAGLRPSRSPQERCSSAHRPRTPPDLSDTGAPASSYQPIYAFPAGTQFNVATAAPGDPGFRGGRWQVYSVELPGGYGAALASGDLDNDGVLDSDEEVLAAE